MAASGSANDLYGSLPLHPTCGIYGIACSIMNEGVRNYLKMAQTSLIVIPAKAGIQAFRGILDPGFRPLAST
jgi:hypothetical protein